MRGKIVMCAPGEETHPQNVDILLDRGVDNLLGGAVQAGVDDVHARVAEAAGDHFHPTIVTVESDFRQKYSNIFAHSRPPRGNARKPLRGGACRTRVFAFRMRHTAGGCHDALHRAWRALGPLLDRSPSECGHG